MIDFKMLKLNVAVDMDRLLPVPVLTFLFVGEQNSGKLAAAVGEQTEADQGGGGG